MLTIADKIHGGSFSLWVYGTDHHKTQAFGFLVDVQSRIEKKLEVIIRQIDTAPLSYSHQHNFKWVEGDVWELKFVREKIRLACIWDKKPSDLVIFYGFKKQGQKWPKMHLENMRTQRSKYLAEPNRIGKKKEG